MKKTPLYTAISTACMLGLTATIANAIDMNITELHFTGGDSDSDGIADNFPLDCTGGPTGDPPAGNNCFATTGAISNASGNFGLFESVDAFFGSPWAAVGVAYFDGFDGSFSEDLDTATDGANITNGTNPAFGAFTQTITPNPDGNPATTDFTYSGITAVTTAGVSPSSFSYTFTLTENQVAWGTLFNWSINAGISVLTIFDCGVSGTVCVPVNTLMANGPFDGSGAVFTGVGSNFSPVAVDDAPSTLVDTLINIDVLANDTDRDETLPVTSPLNITTAPGSGTAVVSAANDGTIDYTPAGLAGGQSDFFEYTVTDSAGNVSAPAARVDVSITVVANADPVANAFATNTDEDTTIAITADQVATDADSGDVLAFSAFQATTVQGGTVTVSSDNITLTYTPASDFSSAPTDLFTYSVTDTKSTSNTETISITVNPINDAPVCGTDASLATAADTPLTVAGNDLVVDCTDVDGDTVTYNPLSTASPVNVTLAEDGAGNITITPDTGATSGSFTFDATDGNGGTVTATANIQIGTVFSNFTMLKADGGVIGGTNDIEFNWDGTFNTDASDKTFGKMSIRTTTPRPYESFFWSADNIRVFGPGTYSFDTSCTTAQYEDTTTDITSCGGPLSPGQSEADRFITITVPPGHVGGHIIFSWGKPNTSTPCGVANCDIDVVNVWEVNGVWDDHGGVAVGGVGFNQLWDGPAGTPPDPTTSWELVNIDSKGRGVNGIAMVDGPFQGLSPTFNSTPASTTTLAPPLQITQGDTDLDDGGLAGMSMLGLFASLLALFGLRSVRRKD